MTNRRRFLLGSAAAVHVSAQTPGGFEYESLRWVEEASDPSLTLETGELVAKVIDNTGLRPRPGKHPMEHAFTHHFGYHGIRALWRKDERRNIVMPFVSWLNLQNLAIEGIALDPVDHRAVFGIGRGWPVRMERDGGGARLSIPRMPVSGVEYHLRIGPGAADAIDFEVTFTLYRKSRPKSAFMASWPLYMSTFDEVQLFAPAGSAETPEWLPFGAREPFIAGDPVNHHYSQSTFRPARPPVLPAVYGRIGPRALMLMFSRPEVSCFLVNAGGHLSFLPVQNPAWDFQFQLSDYEPGTPFGFRGRVIYKDWTGSGEVLMRYREWRLGLARAG